MNYQVFGLRTVFFLVLAIFAQILPIFAHGGEDHGAEQSKTETTDKGTVSRFVRLGELEIMLKHPLFLPDTETSGRLFVTKFETNQGFAEVAPKIEIESANGSVSEAKIEKTDTGGIFNVTIPALPQGAYTIRTKLTYGGETDTATFAGVEVKLPVSAESGEMSWMRTGLIAVIFFIVLGLFGGLIYFVLRTGAEDSMNENAVSA